MVIILTDEITNRKANVYYWMLGKGFLSFNKQSSLVLIIVIFHSIVRGSSRYKE